MRGQRPGFLDGANGIGRGILHNPHRPHTRVTVSGVETIWAIAWLSSWVIRLVLAPIVIVRQKSPPIALAWLAVVMVLPWIGLVLYLLVGEQSLGYGRARRYAAQAHLEITSKRPSAQAAWTIRPGIAERQRVMVHVAESLGGLPILGANSVDLEGSATRFIERLIADINAARHHVHLLYFIFEDDEVGKLVGDALIRAHERGVVCRLLVDAAGSWFFLGAASSRLERAGVKVVAALPAGNLRRRLARIDLRNHRKLAVIDGAIAYAGSHNVIQPDYGMKDVGAWQDLSARIVGPTVGQLQAVFLEDWHFETGEWPNDEGLFPDPVTTGESPLQIVPTGPGEPNAVVRDVMIEALHLARRRVVLTTPYFVPDESLLGAIRLAVARGVQVDLVIPRKSDKWLCDAAGRYFCSELAPLGVRVHFHQTGLLHAKVMTVDDDFAMLGSANFDIRSFFLNFELNLLIYDAQATAQLRFAQMTYIGQSIEIPAAYWRVQPWHQRFGQHAAKLLSPLL